MFSPRCRFTLARHVGSTQIYVPFSLAPSTRSPPIGARQFHPGNVRQAQDLPPGRFRERLANLPEAARLRALEWLRDFHFTELDLHSLHIDASGGIFYADTFTLQATPVPSADEPVIGAAAIPITPFPANLKFHSRPGSPNVLYLNFAGETITSGEWTNEVGRGSIPAVACSTDADYSTYSDTEQLAIKQIWQRAVEDYAPFDIDVTTERPATFTTRTAHALITRNTDANSDPNPYSSSGGVAYVNVFASSSYATYRPAWIYFNNLGNDESYIAEATAHEIGHNLGLSHDGRTDGTEYYGSHGSGDTSWDRSWAPVTTVTSANGARAIIIWPIIPRMTSPLFPAKSPTAPMIVAIPRARPHRW